MNDQCRTKRKRYFRRARSSAFCILPSAFLDPLRFSKNNDDAAEQRSDRPAFPEQERAYVGGHVGDDWAGAGEGISAVGSQVLRRAHDPVAHRNAGGEQSLSVYPASGTWHATGLRPTVDWTVGPRHLSHHVSSTRPTTQTSKPASRHQQSLAVCVLYECSVSIYVVTVKSQDSFSPYHRWGVWSSGVWCFVSRRLVSV